MSSLLILFLLGLTQRAGQHLHLLPPALPQAFASVPPASEPLTTVFCTFPSIHAETCLTCESNRQQKWLAKQFPNKTSAVHVYLNHLWIQTTVTNVKHRWFTSQFVLTLFLHAVIDYVMVSKHAKILVQDSTGSIVSLIEKSNKVLTELSEAILEEIQQRCATS